ncbi:MAG: hypothetical protein ABIT08_00135 [Bacteroidia bacterium]
MIKKMISGAALSMMICAGVMAQTTPQKQVNPAAIQPKPATAPVATPATTTIPDEKQKNTIPERQENQQDRVANGVKSGELTPKEAEHIEKREAAIQKEKKEAKKDGIVTGEEKKEIKKDQKHASKAIHEQKHDDQNMNEKKAPDAKPEETK